MNHKSPAPSKQQWSWAVEFHDGSRIVGTSPEDVLDRWERIAAWLTPDAGGRTMIAYRVHTMYGVILDTTLPAADFLWAGQHAGAWLVIER